MLQQQQQQQQTAITIELEGGLTLTTYSSTKQGTHQG
jgi:hypothetical protein